MICSRLISSFTVLGLIIALQFSAPKKLHALPLEELASFRDWSVFKTNLEYQQNMCYALSTPYKTRALSILRNLPFVVVKYVGGEDFTISATSGFNLDPRYGLVLDINGRDHRLTEGSNSFTWSSSYVQDRAIISDLIENSEDGIQYFKIRSFAEGGDTVLDYYSLLGLKESMQYIVRHCK